MIQRIQTVYLITAVILLVFLVFFPFAEFVRATDDIIFSLNIKELISEADSLVEKFPVYPLTILFSLCGIITLAIIFLYKKRMLQIRLCVLNILLLVGLQGIMYYYVRFAQTFLNGIVSYKIFFVFPLVSAILVFIALRAIARDEALVRSLDRLR
jgi:hypothetical protein